MNKQYDHREAEQRLRTWWHAQQIYGTDRVVPGFVISIDTPPPTVSGSLHIGHIFSYTQTDIIARFLRMIGKRVWYPFGFDDNGLPTERFVEKKRGIVAHQMVRSSFIQVCLDETKSVEQEFQLLWERIGLSVDWRASYTTIGATARKISQESFIRLYEKGYVYRKDEPALYCTSCRTTVAQAELDDMAEQSIFYDVIFKSDAGQSYVVATTRPELLPACVAVLYNPADDRYKHLQGTELMVPVFGHRVPVYVDDSVIPEKGTGLVMCCTFGDTTDIAWYKAHNLPYVPAIGADGRWLPNTGPLAGKTARAARQAAVQALGADGCLGGQREVEHMVNVHERCRQPIEFLVIPQWFLKILPYKQELIALADQINWYPAFMKARYCNWVENITWDWCLSRQRFFGIPFPVWHCTACKAIFMASLEQLPLDPQETTWEGTCIQCGGGPVMGDTDVMDTWNTSSVTPYLCKALYTGNADVFDTPFEPMALRPQAHDIIRTWAFYTMIKTWMHHNTIPWRDIVISGHVLSGGGDKLSKSKSNSILAPEALLEQYSADAIRFWTASGSLGQDVAFSEQQLRIGNRLITKLWNAFYFIAERSQPIFQAPPGKSHDMTHEQHGVAWLQQQPVQLVHRWMGHQLAACYSRYRGYFERYEFGLALTTIDTCFWHDFCDNYLELLKDQFFNPEKYSPDTIHETQCMLARYGLQILQLYAPFVPYVTEEIYQQLYESVLDEGISLHTTQFSRIQSQVHDSRAAESIALVLAIVAGMRRCKTEKQLSLRTDIALLTIIGAPAQLALLECGEQLLLLQGATRSKACVFRPIPSMTSGSVFGSSGSVVTSSDLIPHEQASGGSTQTVWHATITLGA